MARALPQLVSALLLLSPWLPAAPTGRILLEDRFEPIVPAKGAEGDTDPLWVEHLERTARELPLGPRLDFWRVAANPAQAGECCAMRGGVLRLALRGKMRFAGQGVRSRERLDFFRRPLTVSWRLRQASDSYSRVILYLSARLHANGDLHGDRRYLAVLHENRVKNRANLVTVSSKLTDRPGVTERIAQAVLPRRPNRLFRLTVDRHSFRLYADDQEEPIAEGQHRHERDDFPLGAYLYLQARQNGSAEVDAAIDDVVVSQEPPVTERGFITIDLSRHATMALRDEKAGDEQGGWTDQGTNDLRTFPVGHCQLGGVPFLIASNPERTNKSVLVLGSEGNLPFLPPLVADIPVNQSMVTRIHFLQTAAYYNGSDVLGHYVVHVEKYPPAERRRRAEEIALGRMKPEPLEIVHRVPIDGQSVRDWWHARSAPLGPLAWTGAGGSARKVGVHLFTWHNPDPDRRIVSVDFVKNRASTGIPILLGLTLQLRSKDDLRASAAQFTKIAGIERRMDETLSYLAGMDVQRRLLLAPLDDIVAEAAKSGLLDPTGIDAIHMRIARDRSAWNGQISEGVGKLDALAKDFHAKRHAARIDEDVDFSRTEERLSLLADGLKRSLTTADQRRTVALLAAVTKLARDGQARLRRGGPTDASHFGRAAIFYGKVAEIYTNEARRYLSQNSLSTRETELASYAAKHALQFTLKALKNASRPGRPRRGKRRRDLSYDASRGGRLKICLSGTWNFHPGGPLAKAPASGWFDMSVPHMGWPMYGLIHIPGAPRQDVYSFAGIGRRFDPNTHHAWHRVKLPIPVGLRDRVIKVRFEQVFTYAEVYVNDHYCGSHAGSFAPFEVDVTGACAPGRENVMTVLVQDSFRFATGEPYRGKHSPPCLLTYPTGTEEGGILGDVFLATYPLVHVEDVFVQTSVRERRLTVDTWVTNRAARARSVRVAQVVRDDKEEALRLSPVTVSLDPGETKKVTQTGEWSNPKLWGIGGKYGIPHLYDLKTGIADDAGPVDTKWTRFGFREFRIEGTRFLLNGEPISLQGESLTMVGGAYRQNENRCYFHIFYDLLRKAHINLVRCFDPQCPAAYRVADELGMLVTDQFPLNHGWFPSMPENSMFDPAWNHFVAQEYREWVRAHRNHPSIVMWSVENENLSRRVVWKGRRIPRLLEFGETIRQEDPTRPTIHHGNQGFADDPRFSAAVLHYQPRSALTNWREKFRKPVIIGEFFPYGPHQHVARHNDRHGKLSPAEAARAMAESFSRDIRHYRSLGVPGIMPFQLNWSLFDTSQRSHMGPWAGRWKWPFLWKDYPTWWYSMWVDMSWPSFAGEGLKIRRYRATARSAVNWSDPTRPAYVTNAIYSAIRDAFEPMPRLPERRAPEVIVQVTEHGQPRASCVVILTPADGQPAAPVGVRADRQGRAWFRLSHPGSYTATLLSGGRSVRVRADCSPLDAEPGYGHIPRFSLGL